MNGKTSINLTHWILFGLALWLVLVIKDIPASWTGKVASRAMPGLELEGLTGTFWQGRAEHVLLQVEGTRYSLGELRWAVKPGSLLQLTPCADFKTELHRQRLEGKACVHLDGSWSVSDAEFSGPAALAELWVPVRVDGNLSVRLDELRMQADRIESLKGDSSWRDARFHNSHQWLSLGTFAAELNADNNGGVDARIFDLDGAVALELMANFAYRSNTPSLKGTAQLRPGAPQELAQLFTVMGYQEVNGSYDIVWGQP